MTHSLNKIYAVIAGLLMAVSAQVSGADGYSLTNCEPCCDNPKTGITVWGELLYWRPELCGLEAAFGNTSIETTVVGNIITTTVRESHVEPHSKWDLGYRLGAEVNCDCLDVDARWTHFKGGATYHKSSQDGHWDITYDVIDLTLGRSFEVGSCFNLKPFIGIRGARIHQSLHSNLETLFTSPLIGSNTVFIEMDDRESFRGVGPLLGIEADWQIGCGLSLYGRLDFVTYYGNVKGSNFDTDTFTSTVSVCNGSKHGCFNSVGTDLALGVRWEKCMTCSCYDMNFMVNLCLEQHRIYDFSDLGSDGTLSLDGAVIGAGVGIRY